MKLRGSYTVEAALIFSILVPVLITTLYIGGFLTDCVRMSAVMAEGTLSIREDETAGQEWLRGQGGYFSLHGSSVTGGKNRTKVTLQAEERPTQARYGGTFTAEYSCTVRHPAAWVRKIRMLQSLKKEGGE